MSLERQLLDCAESASLDSSTLALAWAAWEGSDALDVLLASDESAVGDDNGDNAGQPSSIGGPEPLAKPTGVWLSSVAVEGFRGIGPRSELLLNPGPGLTLVVGRNGSGKSSFAEGLEALLTGDSLRWRDRPAAWRDGWRNLHHGGPVSVSAEFVREGETVETSVVRGWSDSFEDSSAECTIGPQQVKFEWLGWGEALETFKPFLSYNELGSMLEQKPSAIYDSMATVLGLERLTEARERLRQARLASEKPAKELKAHSTQLQQILESSPDTRGAEAAELIAARKTDVSALRRLAEGGGAQALDGARALAALQSVDSDRCREAADKLSVAVDRVAAVGATDVGRAGRLAALLRSALEHHEGEPAGQPPVACPVCGEGLLDESWRSEAVAEVARLDADAAEASAAEAALVKARQSAIAAVAQPPAVVQAHASDLHDVWEKWSSAPVDGWSEGSLIERLGSVSSINEQIDRVVSEASAELARSDDAWRPFAEQIVAWVHQSEAVEVSSARAKRLKVAEEFFKEAEAALRAERFQPIAERAGELWSVLRQQSNVTLERVALEGSTTQRRVALDVTVDGTDTSALGVMSQGELHALALALFLPRVTSGDSPFRFVLIDDPVQAMDAARVDGLARVLQQVSADRQVVVFTHDDRLPASCRRLGIKADVVRVDRRSGSRVSTSVGESPALDAINNAYTLAKTETIPVELKRSVVPTQCRVALEAQLHDLVWAKLLAEGRSHDEIDGLAANANTTVDLLGLWLFGREESDPDVVYQGLDRVRPDSSKHVRFLQKAVHDPPLDLNPEALTGTIRSLIRTLAER